MTRTPANAAPGQPALPRWLPWAFVLLLVVPFHPGWVDFEQVRRGLLLLTCGAAMLLFRRLPAVRGERAFRALLGFLAASACINLLGQWFAHTTNEPLSFRAWDAAYRLAHWFALLVVLRVGAAAPNAFARPLTAVLLATSTYGVLQHLGIAAIGSYGTAREPVSVFGNLNVASEFTAIAAAGIAALRPRLTNLDVAALAIASLYLVVNGSRSGLVALPLGLLLLFVLRRRDRGWLPLAIATGGALVGLLLALASPRPSPIDNSALADEQKRGTQTVAVRLEIAKGSTKLFAESPVFGHGPGQFAVQYPRVRSQEEIELSSHGRKFASEARTAHDDWIEILVEGGLPGVLFFALLLFALQRGATDRTRQVPLFVLLLLMLVRSPLLNAPAAAIALLLVGRADETVTIVRPRWRTWLARLGAIALIALGILPVVGNTLAIPYLTARAHGDHPPRSAIDAAALVMPFEPRWLQLIAQEQMSDGDLAGAATTAARAVRLRPFDAQLYVLLGEVLARGSRTEEAKRIAQHALKFDPANPELRVLLSTMLATKRETDAAILAVVLTPHPTLRERLGKHFHDLASLADRTDDTKGASRYRAEESFVTTIDGLDDTSPGGLDATSTRVREFGERARAAGLAKTDLRLPAVVSLHALHLGDPDLAIDQGTAAAKLGVTMPAWQRDLFGTTLEPLESIESWRPVLARR